MSVVCRVTTEVNRTLAVDDLMDAARVKSGVSRLGSGYPYTLLPDGRRLVMDLI